MTRPSVISVAITGSVPRKADNPSEPASAAEDRALLGLSEV